MYYKAAAGSWTQVVSITDSTYSGSGRIGLHTEETIFRLDDFGGGTMLASGGVQVSSRSDTLSDSRLSATSNHTIVFTSNNSFNTTSTNATSTLTLAFPSGFSLSNIFCKDVDISFGGTATSIAGNFANRSISKNCPGTATTWGLFIDTSANALTFYTLTAAAIYVATGTQVQILIGTNATFQDAASKWITNPSTGGVYTISVGGTFGGSGNMLVAIRSGVTVQATVAESLSFTVSSVGASAFPASGILDNFNRADGPLGGTGLVRLRQATAVWKYRVMQSFQMAEEMRIAIGALARLELIPKRISPYPRSRQTASAWPSPPDYQGSEVLSRGIGLNTAPPPARIHSICIGLMLGLPLTSLPERRN
jgi:hypothetical protein